MATVKLANFARMTVSGTPGTGTITLLAAVTGFLTFALAGVASGATVTYAIKDGNNREVGRGVYTTAGLTLTRGTILASTNGGAAISATSAAVVSIVGAAEDFMMHDEAGNMAMPASAYMNFNTTFGSSGYGFRDNGGGIQVKNVGGGWGNINQALAQKETFNLASGTFTTAVLTQDDLIVHWDTSNMPISGTINLAYSTDGSTFPAWGGGLLFNGSSGARTFQGGTMFRGLISGYASLYGVGANVPAANMSNPQIGVATWLAVGGIQPAAQIVKLRFTLVGSWTGTARILTPGGI